MEENSGGNGWTGCRRPLFVLSGGYICGFPGTRGGCLWQPVVADQGASARPDRLAAGVVAFALAATLVSLRPRLGHTAALIAGLVSFSCLAWTELSGLVWANSWILLNVPGKEAGGYYEGPGIFTFARGLDLPLACATILAVALTVIALVFSGLRLLPANWIVLGSPLRERAWPAFGASAFVLVAWYGCSVTPYRIPATLNHTDLPALQILHTEKRGLLIRETAVRMFKDGKFERWQRTRRLFEYSFTGQAASGVVPTTLRSRALDLAGWLPESERTAPAKALNAWSAEGWYVHGSRRLLSYTSEYRSVPPAVVVDLFKSYWESPVTRTYQRYTEKDVCLGFCYDPPAALGLVYKNQHCQTYTDGTTRCP